MVFSLVKVCFYFLWLFNFGGFVFYGEGRRY